MNRPEVKQLPIEQSYFQSKELAWGFINNLSGQTWPMMDGHYSILRIDRANVTQDTNGLTYKAQVIAFAERMPRLNLWLAVRPLVYGLLAFVVVIIALVQISELLARR